MLLWIVVEIRPTQLQPIVMTTRGHGKVGYALTGSIAQQMVSDCNILVLLAKQALSAAWTR